MSSLTAVPPCPVWPAAHIPYLNLALVGKRVDEVPRPKDLGYTLCGLMLDRAYLEVRAQLEPAAEGGVV